MKFVMDGARAGLVIAGVLTLWSVLGVSAQMGGASDAAGVLYAAVAFGLLTVMTMGLGIALGAVVGVWRWTLAHSLGARLMNAIREDASVDRVVAGAIFAAPLIAAAAGAVVAGAHFAVTSKFVRVGFQSAGLALITAAATGGLLLLAPTILAVTRTLARLIPRSAKRPASATALVVLIATGILGAVGGWYYASSLDVFDAATLQMGLVALLGTPAIFWLMQRWPSRSLFWTYGLPVAGGVLATICFVGAANWSSSTAAMREAVSKGSSLVAPAAGFLQRFTDGDGDGFPSGYGGADCDDANDAVFPGAREIPGNKIDENCSGADAAPPSGADHPSRKLVSQAIDAAQGAAKKTAENLPDPPKNLLVLLVDTLRVDHLQFMGYDRNTSPNIDAIAAEGTVFARTYATSPHTPRSIPAIFFSRYPSRTQWRGGQYNYPKIKPENLGLFEVLADAGHQNYGMSSHFYFDEKRGIRQGFTEWNNDGAGTIAESNDDIASPRTWEKVEPLIDELAARHDSPDARPFSLFVHLFEPHARWIQHDEFKFPRKEGGDSRIDAYDSEIAFMDSYVGKIVDKFKATGLWDDTVVVLVSDHGEGFNEHGYFFHGQTLYNEIVHVPLVIRVPGWFHRTIETPTSLVDIAPTLVDLFGYPIPEDFDGVSLAPAMVGEPLTARPIYVELLPYTSWKEHHKAVIDGSMKFISVYTSGAEELYDLSKDPGEQVNLVKKDEETAERMRKLLERFTQMP